MRAAPRSTWLLDSPGAVLELFRNGEAGLTKSELVRRSGLSRSAVNQRIDLLLAAGILEAAEHGAPTGGRPAERFRLKADRGVVAIADCGATGARMAIADMRAELLSERFESIDIARGPGPVLDQISRGLAELLEGTGHGPGDVLAVGIDLPGPVDHATGRIVSPPIMPGWHHFDIPGYFGSTYECPVVVEKDVNAMAFGEHRLRYPATDNLVFLKLGTGLGAGLVVNGEIYRGSDGAAGDIGHIPLGVRDDEDAPVCRCGNFGCVEAYASGWALARDLRALGHDITSVNDVTRAIFDRQPDAVRLMRAATTIVGRAVSDLVNIANPKVVVIGGQLAVVDDVLLAGVREVVYHRSLPLATRSLRIVRSARPEYSGVDGLIRLSIDEAYSSDRVNHMVAHLDTR